MKIFKKIVIPDDKELFFIGDLHGNKKEFDYKLKEYGIDPDKDHIVMAGDIADRGNDIVPLFFDFLNKPNYHMVMGNHEDFLINYENRENYINWVTPNNGGDKTLEQMGEQGIKYFAKEIIQKVPLILEVHHRGKVFGVVHAGIPLFYDPVPVNNWKNIINKAKKDKLYAEQLMWDRHVILRVAKNMYQNIQTDYELKKNDFKESLLNLPDSLYRVTPEEINDDIPGINGIDYVIHGHTGVFAPVMYKNMLWIDTKFATNYFTLLNFNNLKDKWDVYFKDESFI